MIKYIMNFGVFKLVLLLVVEHNAVMIHKIEDANSPKRTIQKLDKKFVLPFLH